jgi:hypothetical protein
MATGYTPIATQDSQPTASQTVFSAAEEFRTLKASVNAMRQWLGVSATAPTTDTLGDPLTAGDFYYNSASLKMFVFSGGVWVPVDKTSIVSITSGSVGITIASTADIVIITPAANFSITDSSMGNGQVVLVLITNPGIYTVTWPTGIKWLNGVTPTLLAAGTTFVEILKANGVIYGVALGGAV